MNAVKRSGLLKWVWSNQFEFKPQIIPNLEINDIESNSLKYLLLCIASNSLANIKKNHCQNITVIEELVFFFNMLSGFFFQTC